MSTAAAIVLFVGVTAYAIFGGADFGAGFWDLVAGGTRRGSRPREVIDHSIAPVWEANHVWLIFCFVVLWTCFPEAYASITLTLFVPLTIAAFGIVLRGASFAFRKSVFRTRDRRNFGAAFAVSSVLVSVLHGRGRRRDRVGPGARRRTGRRSVVELGEPHLDPGWRPRRLRRPPTLRRCTSCGTPAGCRTTRMVEYFRVRAFGSGLVAGAVAFVGIFVLRADATYLFHGLETRALPLVILSAVSGVGSLFLLHRENHRGARLAAILAAASVVIAWGVAQWDYILPESMTVDQAVAPNGTVTAVLVAVGLAVVLILPAFALLYVLDQRGLLPEESVAEPSSTSDPALEGGIIMTAPDHTVLIVGGGFAGVGCARELAKKHIDVTLVDRNDYHQFQPLLYQLATAQLAVSDLARPLRGIFIKDDHVRVVTGTVTAVDPAARSVTFDDGTTLQGDVLVLAAGARPNFFDTPGRRASTPTRSTRLMTPSGSVLGSSVCSTPSTVTRRSSIGARSPS